ncbi:MAG: transcriptional repressor [Candidatus Saccharimonadales bacterium]
MVEPLQQLKTTLKHGDFSLTRTRQLVFAALQDKEPQTMHELILACQQSMDRATVYRTIELFERLGIVQRLQIGWKYKLELSDAFHHHHHHLTCQVCGQTFALPEDDQLEKRLRQLAQTQHFTMRGHQLEIQGVCQSCNNLSPVGFAGAQGLAGSDE